MLSSPVARHEGLDSERSQALVRAWIDTHDPETLPWSWEETVALEGLLAHSRASGDPAAVHFARAWVEAAVSARAFRPVRILRKDVARENGAPEV